MANVKLLPLPEHFAHQSERVQQHVRDYACANVAHATAAKDAEIEALRAEVEESDAVVDKLARVLAETAIVIKGPEPDMTKWSYHDIPDSVRAIQARAERLAEELRAARRALAFAAQHLPECNEPYERANAALAQEDRND